MNTKLFLIGAPPGYDEVTIGAFGGIPEVLLPGMFPIEVEYPNRMSYIDGMIFDIDNRIPNTPIVWRISGYLYDSTGEQEPYLIKHTLNIVGPLFDNTTYILDIERKVLERQETPLWMMLTPILSLAVLAFLFLMMRRLK